MSTLENSLHRIRRKPAVFSCLNGHELLGWDERNEPLDLDGYLCPVCVGRVTCHVDIVDGRILRKLKT